MKWGLLFLALPLSVFAQQPAKQLKFLPASQSAFVGQESVSPDRKKLLVTFWKGDTNSYELVDLVSLQLLSSGNLPGRVNAISWSSDGNLVAADFIELPAQCFDTRNGMKKLFSCERKGAVTFSGKSLLAASQSQLLYVFNEEYIYRYDLSGKLLDSIELEGMEFFNFAWYNAMNQSYCVVNDLDDAVILFSGKGEKLKTYTVASPVLQTIKQVDKDGKLYMYGGDNTLHVLDVSSGKNLLTLNRNKIYAAAFTPDSRGIIIKTPEAFEKISLETKQSTTVASLRYYHSIAFTSFGTEMACVNTEGVDVYACKDYLPQLTQSTAPVVKNNPAPAVKTPVAKTTPPVTKTDPAVPVPSKWTLPYRIVDFITPLNRDSFYLYSPDKGLHYYIVYRKGQSSILWPDSYEYFQYMGFKGQQQFSQVSTYILDVTDSTARLGSYAKSGLIEKPMMIGGQNYLGKLSLTGKEVKWTGEMYGEKQTYTAKVIDNTYKGVRAKCLVVSRNEMSNGHLIDESYFYQQGVGLIKIESGGKVAFQRM